MPRLCAKHVSQPMESLSETLTFVFDALTRIKDRQEQVSYDTAEDLQDIQNAIERLRNGS